jgi:hypothetical protein
MRQLRRREENKLESIRLEEHSCYYSCSSRSSAAQEEEDGKRRIKERK